MNLGAENSNYLDANPDFFMINERLKNLSKLRFKLDFFKYQKQKLN